MTDEERALLADIHAVYRRNCMGCCLHIVLDDGNIRAADVQFCLAQAIDEGCYQCEDLARKLLALSEWQRLKLCRRFPREIRENYVQV